MGYMSENLKASEQIASNILQWVKLTPATTQIEWPRHGFLTLLFDVPFVLLSRILFGSSTEWSDYMLAMEPILTTSCLCALIFVWVRRITSSPMWGYVLALVAGLSTMLWPYAYIGLETTQSLFLLLSAYLAFCSVRRTWSHTLLFGFVCAVAAGVKLNGLTLAPAVGFLILCYFYEEGTGFVKSLLLHWRKVIAVALIVAGVYVLNAHIQTIYFTNQGFTVSRFDAYFTGWLVDSPVTFALHVFSYFCSPNKGLFIYAPVVILCLASLYKGYRTNPRIVIFTGLTLAGMVGGFALTYLWGEETWGPRYLHQSVAPLIICFALTRKAIAFRLRREIPLIVLAVIGFAVSFLGSFFYYGSLNSALHQSSQSTLEGIQYDVTYNHIRFNSKLLHLWLRGRDAPSEQWPPAHHWLYTPPPDAQPFKTVDLKVYASPQPALISRFRANKVLDALIITYSLSLLLSCALIVWSGRLAARKEARPDQLELPGLIT
jgi:hypothetical protein